MGGFRDDSPMARIARVIVPGACCVGRSLALRDHKRKAKILEIKYDVPVINCNFRVVLDHKVLLNSRRNLFAALNETALH